MTEPIDSHACVRVIRRIGESIERVNDSWANIYTSSNVSYVAVYDCALNTLPKIYGLQIHPCIPQSCNTDGIGKVSGGAPSFE